MKPVQFSTELTLTAAADDGKPRRFEMQAYNGGTLPVKGYSYPVVVDLSTLKEPPSMPILIDHQQDVESTLGSTDTIENTGTEPLVLTFDFPQNAHSKTPGVAG